LTDAVGLFAGQILRREGLERASVVLQDDGVDLAVTGPNPVRLPVTTLDEAPASYFVEGLPVEIHCHSMGQLDLSDFAELDLHVLDGLAAAEGVACVPTVYLRRDRLDEFVQFMKRFRDMRQRGLLPFLPAVALEGPLLASHGGTPAATVWPPTRKEWDQIASCGSLGLVYVVVSPNGLTPASDLYDRLTRDHPDLDWIVRTLVRAGIRPALGHYAKDDPDRAADLTCQLVETAWSEDSPIPGARVVTDHLFNDMPLAIRHAFRTRRARAERNALIAAYDLPSWNLDDLPEQVGPVPAAIMRLCHDGKVASCINFDGEHVDLAIAARAVEVIGPGNIMLMTDRCDSATLGGQKLYPSAENSLWYQDGGIVAAGSQPLDVQIRNARRGGISESRLWDLVSFTAYSTLGLDSDPWLNPARSGSFVLADPADPTDRTGFRRHAVVSTSPLLADKLKRRSAVIGAP
jgi:N-acetylglucosamine-6-phosphate deacetylase